MNQIDEQRTFAKSFSLQKIFIPKLLFLRITYFSKATYLAGIADLSIFPDVGSYLLEKKLTITEAVKSNFTSAINTKTTPADTNKKSGMTNEDLEDNIIYGCKGFSCSNTKY